MNYTTKKTKPVTFIHMTFITIVLRFAGLVENRLKRVGTGKSLWWSLTYDFPVQCLILRSAGVRISVSFNIGIDNC